MRRAVWLPGCLVIWEAVWLHDSLLHLWGSLAPPLSSFWDWVSSRQPGFSPGRSGYSPVWFSARLRGFSAVYYPNLNKQRGGINRRGVAKIYRRASKRDLLKKRKGGAQNKEQTAKGGEKKAKGGKKREVEGTRRRQGPRRTDVSEKSQTAIVFRGNRFFGLFASVSQTKRGV